MVEDRVFAPREIAMVVPPAGHYYQVEDKTYQVRTSKALRESGALAR
ncbi:MAG TPA: hypothetical protein VFZ94_04410 [Burkholderiales bacterium]